MNLALLAALNKERAARRAAVMVTDTSNGFSELVLAEDLIHRPLVGTLKGEAIAIALRQGKSTMVEIEGQKLFLTVHVPSVKAIVVGAVHISQAMVPMARVLGLDLTIIDPRTAFASPERFPDVKMLAEWPDIALPLEGIDQYSAFVALTHDPKIDDPGLHMALKAQCFYIGALGSRKTHAGRVQRLVAAGFSQAQIGRIHAPVGLDIGAVSPAEIALSIVGDIIAALRKPVIQ